MARGINKVILVGNCGQDPDTKYSAGGAAVTNISVATSEAWKDKQTGQVTEKTEWHRVVFFNRLAEIAGEYLRKGSKVYIEGKLQTRKWQDQSGQDRYTTEIVANELQMLDSRGDNMPAAGGGGASYGQNPMYPPQGGQQDSYSAPAPKSAPYGAPANRGATPPPPPPPAMDSFDDDIPF